MNMLYIFLFIFGTAIGSFLNVVIDRLSNEESVMGRSHCDHCKHKLGPLDLIPIVSFFLLNRKCRYCKKNFSWYYPIVEFITGISFVLIFNFQFLIFNENFKFQISNWFYFIIYLVIISCLIVIFFSDLKYHIIPDQVQIFLFAASLFLLPLYGSILNVFIERVIAALLVMAPIYFLYWVTKGRGMGFGDVKLAFIIGFMFGIKAGLLVLYFAFISGAIIGVILMLFQKRGLKSKIAFGPFLVIGILIMLFWRDGVFELIKRIYGV